MAAPEPKETKEPKIDHIGFLSNMVYVCKDILHEDTEWSTCINQVGSWYTWAKTYLPQHTWPEEQGSRNTVIALDDTCENMITIHRYQSYNCPHKCRRLMDTPAGEEEYWYTLLQYAFLYSPYFCNAKEPLETLLSVDITDFLSTSYKFLLDQQFLGPAAPPWALVACDGESIPVPKGQLLYSLHSFALETSINLRQTRFELLSSDVVLRVSIKKRHWPRMNALAILSV